MQTTLNGTLNRVYDRLPEPLKVAQNAINLPEVQEMMKKLATYNLGVFMPHQHNEQSGDFEELPVGVVQMENDLKISFLSTAASEAVKSLPVGWIWQKNGIKASATCIAKCTLTVTPGGKEFHVDEHKGGGHPYP
jgi:hypothetical protein